MPVYNSIECSDNYSKRSASLWQYYRDKPFLNGDFPADNNNSISFKLKQK